MPPILSQSPSRCVQIACFNAAISLLCCTTEKSKNLQVWETSECLPFVLVKSKLLKAIARIFSVVLLINRLTFQLYLYK